MAKTFEGKERDWKHISSAGFGEDAEKFGRNLRAWEENDAVMKEAKEFAERSKKIVFDLLTKYRQDEVCNTEGIGAFIVTQNRSSFDKKKLTALLMEEGMSAGKVKQIMEKCTSSKTTSYAKLAEVE